MTRLTFSHDFNRFDAENRGKVTGAKRQSIRTMAVLFGRSPETIARQLNLDVSEVNEVLENVYSLAPSAR